MFYKNIIFDLDNTLYNYDVCHENSINKVFKFIHSILPTKLNVSIESIKKSFYDISGFFYCYLHGKLLKI